MTAHKPMPTAPIAYPPILLSITQAAAYLGRSVTSLRALPIPRKLDGGRVFYHRLDLDAYAASLAYEGDENEVDQWDKRVSG